MFAMLKWGALAVGAWRGLRQALARPRPLTMAQANALLKDLWSEAALQGALYEDALLWNHAAQELSEEPANHWVPLRAAPPSQGALSGPS
jgi:hypothetical protein